MTALVSHQCSPGSTPGVDAICGLSLLLVLSFAPRGFSPGTPVFPSPQKLTLPNSNSIWNARTRFNEFIRTPMFPILCFVGKQVIYNFFFYKENSRQYLLLRRENRRWVPLLCVTTTFTVLFLSFFICLRSLTTTMFH